MKRIILQIGKWTGIAFAALIVVGVVYQQIGLVTDSSLAPPQSQMVKVNGRSFHLKCMGAGSRTFILDAGHASWSFAWWRIQPRLAKIGRACAFDRAGLGWSDLAPGGFDGIGAADRLAALVKAAGIHTPFIYVGHSLGANFGLIYAARHPKDVSALVLLDPGDPAEMLKSFHGTEADAMAASDCGALCVLVVGASHLGITRFMMRNAGQTKLDEPERDDFRAGFGKPGTIYAIASTMGAFPKTAFETRAIRSLGDLPVLIVTSSDAGVRAADIAALKRLSPNVTGPVTIPHSDHISMVGGRQPSAVTAATIATFVSGLPNL